MAILSIMAAAAAASLSPVPVSSVTSLAMLQIPRLGGYSAADPSDEGVQNAAAFAAGQLGSELREVESAERQSVAGTNYQMIIWTTAGERWRVVVYQPLRGDLQLTGQEQLEVADIGPATAGEEE